MLMVVLSRRQSTKLSLAEIKHIFKYSFCLYNHHSPKTFTAQTFSWVKPYPDEKGIGMVKYANHSEKKKKWKCRDYCCLGQERMWSSNAIVHACIFWNVKEQQIILDHKMMRKRYLPILGTSKNQFFRHSSMKLLYCITLKRSTLFWKLICNLLY